MLFRRIARIVARLGPFVVVIAVAAGARAAPMTYFVGFSGVGTLPALGAFTYDAAAPGFSNFIVLWNGTLFDLTSAANAPNIGGACAGAASSPETGFALMDHSMCGGLFSRWFGNQDVASSTFGFYNETLALPAQTGATILATGPGSNDPFSVFGAGEWTLTGAKPGAFNYVVNFSGVGTLPALGIFSYDPSTPLFSNFVVSWNDTLFDLTSAANAPNIGGACAGATSSPETGFALMDHSMCGGLFSRWFGNQDAASSTFGFYNETLALPAQTGATILATGPGSNDPFSFFGAGEWTLTELPGGPVPPSAPEPSTAMLVLLAGLIIAACRAIPTRRRLSS